ncbi:M24 family metallopeptidase [Candidatus Daviesbacteria bacterium]|nr:M24 family metallopeptidase [Candidatus Daviesbacteria bacterium]
MADRIVRLRQKLKHRHLDGLLVASWPNRQFLTGFSGTSGWVVVTGREQLLAVDSRYTIQASRQAGEFEVHEVSSFKEWWQQFAKRVKGKRIAFESHLVPFAQVKQLKDHNIKLVASKYLVEEIRQQKDDGEQKLLLQAQQITDKAYSKLKKKIKLGMTEQQIAWVIEKILKELGAGSLAWQPLVVAIGSNSASPHHPPGKRKLTKGDFVQLDFGCTVASFCSDMSRVMFFGTPDRRAKIIYQAVLEAQEYAKTLIKPGVKVAAVDQKVRQFLQNRGFSESEIYKHSLGHGIGLEVHEMPNISVRSKEKFAPGMVVTVEPGIYLAGWGGVRLEDEVLVTADGIKTLTGAAK